MTSGEVGIRPAMSFSPGVTLGSRYTLRRNIGSGGYSEVWEAQDAVLDRPVAVKLLHAEHTRHAETLHRFRTEAQLAARLSDANLARVYDFNDAASDGTPYLVMEFVDGPTLAQLLRRGPLSPAATMDILAQAASGLQAAHAGGMVHRDIKPSNIMLAPGNVVKITDFGLSHTLASAPITHSGMVAGTPGFMAPERAAGVRASAASDLYALGVVGYECLAGAPPFEGTPIEVALAHRDSQFPPLPVSTPGQVAALIGHLTAKDPADRPASAGLVAREAAELRDGLRAAAYGRDDLTAPVSSYPDQTRHTLIVPPVPGAGYEPEQDAGYEPGQDPAHRGPSAAVGWLLAGALGLAAMIAIIVIALAHRPTPPAATQGNQSGSTPQAVVVSRSALIGEPARQAYQQLRQHGFRVRIQYQPSPQQPPGTVVAVRPFGPQQPGSLITLVVATHGHHKGHGGDGNGNGGGDGGGGDNG